MKRLAVVVIPAVADDFTTSVETGTLAVWEDEGQWNNQFFGLKIIFNGERSNRQKGDVLVLPWASILYYEVSELKRGTE